MSLLELEYKDFLPEIYSKNERNMKPGKSFINKEGIYSIDCSFVLH